MSTGRDLCVIGGAPLLSLLAVHALLLLCLLSVLDQEHIFSQFAPLLAVHALSLGYNVHKKYFDKPDRQAQADRQAGRQAGRQRKKNKAIPRPLRDWGSSQ